MKIQKQEARKLIGKHIYALKKDGTVVNGKLVRVSGQRLFVQKPKGKKVHIKAIIPLVLFDLLAIGTAPFAYGGYGFGAYGAYPGAVGAFPGAVGYPGVVGYPGYFF